MTPMGKYSYQQLPMGINCAPDICQNKMNDLMSGIQYICTYLDDLLTLSNGDCSDHLKKIATVLNRLSGAGLEVHIKKINLWRPQRRLPRLRYYYGGATAPEKKDSGYPGPRDTSDSTRSPQNSRYNRILPRFVARAQQNACTTVRASGIRE